MNRFWILGVVVTCWLVLGNQADAHPFHSSHAEMEWNEESACFEVSVRVASIDLEKVLRKRTGRIVRIDDPSASKKIFEYVSETFEVTAGGKKLAFQSVGIDSDVRHTWIYFELKPLMGRDDLLVENKLLLEMHDQVNSVTILQPGEKQTFNFTAETDQKKLLWDAKEKSYRWGSQAAKDESRSPS
ncbi:hypothetical protein KOR42_19230 [Thalassoglobus neptunius]|uniref:Uncharacterized protein n=1 Tax=Thalassoglobus neptunius TaxID=1938619 RepID=A0A5C5X9K4_9PLAN|nr:DUF6702 family protein [Thalassoglobus neptunius]TWT58542.1 hypothetical protein KOR42_19230 [Thalassoglobus neptunius]